MFHFAEALYLFGNIRRIFSKNKGFPPFLKLPGGKINTCAGQNAAYIRQLQTCKRYMRAYIRRLQAYICYLQPLQLPFADPYATFADLQLTFAGLHLTFADPQMTNVSPHSANVNLKNSAEIQISAFAARGDHRKRSFIPRCVPLKPRFS